MKFPQFFNDVPTLRTRDPLAKLLGCAEDGVLEYSFADAVRLTGHACPTVACAYWLTFLALERLYPDSLPERGAVQIQFRETAGTGTTGVTTAIVQMLTGAAGATGFNGIGGRFGRAGLIRFMPELLSDMRFTRLDTRAAVDVSAHMDAAPANPEMEPLLAKALAYKASPEEETRLATLWQQRVRQLLIELPRDTAMFDVRDVDLRKLHATSLSARTVRLQAIPST